MSRRWDGEQNRRLARDMAVSYARPYLAWRPAWILGPAPEAKGEPSLQRDRFRTTATTGCFENEAHPGLWHLDIGAPADATFQLTAHGCRVAPPQDATIAAVESGLLIADLPAGFKPRLASEGYPLRSEGAATVIEIDDAWVVLHVERRGARLHVVLAHRAGPLDEALAWARRRAGDDAARALAEAHAPYEAFWLRQAGLAAADADLLAAAVDSLLTRLRPPVGVIAFPWSASDVGYPAMATADVFPLVRAWSVLQPRTAAGLLKAILSAQREDGSLPAVLRPDGLHDATFEGWPMLAQAALLAWQAAPSRDFFDFVLPRLHRHLQWVIRHFDPEQSALPLWPDPQESFLPATHDERVATADLPAFLCAEIDALTELSAAVAVGGIPLHDLERYRLRLQETLTGFFWNESSRLFKDRQIEGPAIARETLSATVPLLVASLPEEFTQPVAERLTQADHFLTARGWQSWLPWPSDTEAPPILPAHQLLLFTALERHAPDAVPPRVREAMVAALRPDGDAMRPAAEEGADQGQAVHGACLAVVVLARRAAGLLEGTPISPLLLWLDRHRVPVFTTATLALVLLLGTVIAGSCSKKALTRQAMETTAGLARRYYAESRYDDSVNLLREIADSGRTFPGLYVAMGNAQFRAGRLDLAEKAYRDELARNPAHPAALQNLALTLLRSGRTNEAVAVWQQATNDLAIVAPDVAARARTALSLLDIR